MLKLWLSFCCPQQKIQKMNHFWHFNDHNSGSKDDNKKNNLIFFIYSLTSSPWYISFLYLKTFKIQFLEVPPSLYYALVCKIHIYMLKMILSSLLIWISFYYIKFDNFWYITCSVPNLISMWLQSQGLIHLLSISVGMTQYVCIHLFWYQYDDTQRCECKLYYFNS